MITKLELKKMSSENIDAIERDRLIDISAPQIPRDPSVTLRTLLFMEQIGNPYLFKVDNTPVKVSFTQKGASLQSSLEKFFSEQ